MKVYTHYKNKQKTMNPERNSANYGNKGHNRPEFVNSDSQNENLTKMTRLDRESGVEIDPTNLSEIALNMGHSILKVVEMKDLIQNYLPENPNAEPEYAVFDPRNFDPENSQGFIKLNPNQALELGREHNYAQLNNYNHDPTMSRKHAIIEMRDGKLRVYNKSGNGTDIIQTKREKNIENAIPAEVQKYLKNNPDIQDFADFFKTEQANIQESYARGELKEFIYQKFYSSESKKSAPSLVNFFKKTETNRIKPSDEEAINYHKSVDGQTNYAREFNRRTGGKSVEIKGNEAWFSLESNYADERTGEGKIKDIGRFYLNIDQKLAPLLQREFTLSLWENKLSFQMKIPRFMTERSANRHDKAVLYFDLNDFDKVAGIAESIHQKYANSFQKEKPRFTKGLLDKKGQVLQGIGFAEEPSKELGRGHSFGTLRSEILAKICEKSLKNKQKNLDLNKPEVAEYFRRLCEQSIVSPTDPAFNLNSPYRSKISKRLA